MRLIFQLLRSPSFWITLAVAGIVDGIVYLFDPTPTRAYSISGTAGVITFLVVAFYRTFGR